MLIILEEQIENKKRMAFLSKLNQEMQTQIVFQTGNLNDIPLENVIHVAKDLKKKATFYHTLNTPILFFGYNKKF